MQPPAYFDDIRRRSTERWGQLERDPELAGPWHQLFRQVQSPRHVLSELLQNADDAGAKAASVRVENNTFVFEHDGHIRCGAICISVPVWFLKQTQSSHHWFSRGRF